MQHPLQDFPSERRAIPFIPRFASLLSFILFFDEKTCIDVRNPKIAVYEKLKRGLDPLMCAFSP